MPELPEVETVARDLRPLLEGERIDRVEVRFPSLVRYPEAEQFAAALAGARIESVGRRGKYLLLRVGLEDAADRPVLLVVHLGMTGQLRRVPAGTPEPDHLHVIFHLAPAGATAGPVDPPHDELRYRDPRRFGRLLLGTEEELRVARAMPRLGPEPLDPAFDGALLYSRLHPRRAPVKALLLDQEVVAGVGNIYADEALYRSRVRPQRRANTLSKPAAGRLAASLREVLCEAIAHRGSSVVDYRDVWGELGEEQARLQAYGRAGEPCLRCGRPLRLDRVAGRSTVFCRWCQR